MPPRTSQPSGQKSTNDRLISAAFGFASQVAPDLTARWAEKAFLTPGRKPPSPDELAILDRGHRFSVPFGGGHLAAWSWGDGPTVYLVHGWGVSAGRMTPLVDPLLRNGFSVVAFDAPGHGLSAGKTSSVIEIAAGFRAVVDWTAAGDAGSHAGAIGHSVGGSAIGMAMKHGPHFRRVVFIGSPSSLEARSREGATHLGLSSDVVSRMQTRIEGRFGIKWKELSVENYLPDPPVPLLLVHDVGDRSIPVEESARIAGIWPGAERLLTEGLGHNRILQEPEVIARAVAFIAHGPSTVSVRPRTSGSQKRTLERGGMPAQKS